jgi:hypothetical protein
MITAVITEPERAINHFKNTRKSGFVCITLFSGDLSQFLRASFSSLAFSSGSPAG